MRTVYLTKKQIETIKENWNESSPIINKPGDVSVASFATDDNGCKEDDSPTTTDNFASTMNDPGFFGRYGTKTQTYRHYGVNESYTQQFLNKKFKASETSKDKMTIKNANGFVSNYINGDTSLKALRQKVYNMEHGKSSEDPETQKQIVNAYNNAKKINASNQSAIKDTKNNIPSSIGIKNNNKNNNKIITYFS